jgi:phosphoribosylamine--glycine ligase
MEGSKAFAKRIMSRMGVPTAEYAVFQELSSAKSYVRDCALPVVVKADGLAAGKGVRICTTRTEAVEAVADLMGAQVYGTAGATLVIEEFLEGRELSFMALVDGTTIVPLATSQDHKRLMDNDLGPNTGGMGAYSPSPIADQALLDRVMHEVMLPTVQSMAEQGLCYRGFLYAGLMVSERGPSTLEFNVRLGDPETQPLLFRMRSDLAHLLLSARDGLHGLEVDWDPRPAVCLVMASEGYPTKPIKGRVITGLSDVAKMTDVMVFHAGTRLGDGGAVLTSGGRVLGVTATGATMAGARDRAYEAADLIHFDGQQMRRDIGASI